MLYQRKCLLMVSCLMMILPATGLPGADRNADAQSSYADEPVPATYCRRAERPLILTPDYFAKFDGYYNEKVITQQLLMTQVICDLGAPAELSYARDDKFKEILGLKLKGDESIYRYGSYVSVSPVADLSVVFIVRPDGIVKSYVRLQPGAGKINTVIKGEDLLAFSIGEGTYTAETLTRYSTDTRTSHYLLSK